MKSNLKMLASLVLASALVASAQTATSSAAGTAKSKITVHKARRPKAPAKPSVESQIESLRQDMETQIQALKQQLADRDTQLQQAQQTAASAQQAAQQAQQANQMQQQAATETSASVSNLQNAVSDLKTTTNTQVMAVQSTQAKLQKSFENPDSIHFKGITLSPTGSFIEAATVNRTRATGSDIPTPFASIPLTASDAGQLSEFYGTGRQSRLALTAEGKVSNAIIRGYYEADWLGTGVTSNNNQSNSYVFRQRQLWAQAELNNHWTITGGQMWTLATEYLSGLSNKREAVPFTIDPNYQVGFVWNRQYGFRVVRNFDNKVFLGVSVENAQDITPSCQASGTGVSCPTNYLIGSAGNGGGLYNGGGQPGATSSAPLALYSFNLAPDLIAKVAFEPGYGHYEIFGIARFFRDRVYPNVATKSGAGAYNDSTVGGGLGASARFPIFAKRMDIGAKGLYGDGTQRYGASTLSDLTLRPDGQLGVLHGFSTMEFIEGHATPRLDVYGYYGMDYVGRSIFADGAGYEGYGLRTVSNTACGTEPLPASAPQAGYSPSAANCPASNKDVQEGTFGEWYDFYKGDHGRLRQGFQYSYVSRQLWSGIGYAPKAIDNVFETSLRYYMP